jgi:hypothetical protein
VARSRIGLDEAVALTRTGDIWLFRGRKVPDRAIQMSTNSPVNHVGMAVVLDDLPPLMWHAELGRSLLDVWSGTHQRGVQLHDLRDAVLTWGHRYGQRAWLRQLEPAVTRQQEDAILRTVARLDGTPFPSTARLAGRWLRGRTPVQRAGSLAGRVRERVPLRARAADPTRRRAYGRAGDPVPAPLRDGGSGPLRDGGSGPLRDGGSGPLRGGGSGPLRGGGSGPLRGGGSGPLGGGGSGPLRGGGPEPLGGGGPEPLRGGAHAPGDTAQERLETTYCAEVVAVTYEAMGLLPTGRLPQWYDPGRFWSGDDLRLTGGARLGGEIAVDLPPAPSRR